MANCSNRALTDLQILPGSTDRKTLDEHTKASASASEGGRSWGWASVTCSSGHLHPEAVPKEVIAITSSGSVLSIPAGSTYKSHSAASTTGLS